MRNFHLLAFTQVTAALLAVTMAPGTALAGFVKEPYLQNATQTSIVVAWEFDSERTGAVRYGETEDLPFGITTSMASFQQAALTGLTPSTVYYYQVTVGESTSAVGTFTTAPWEEEPFSFVVVGDTRTSTDDHQAVIDRVARTVGYPDIYFNTGDLVEDGGDSDQWDTFFTIEADLLAHAPLYPVAGNHDDVVNDSLYVQFFDLPASTSATENWYAFTYGNTRFMVADTNEDYVAGSEQYQWLEAQLAAADVDPAISHKIVLFHDPPYTSGAHGVFDYEDWGPARTWLVPLVTRYGVDVVFNGHDHHYERTDVSATDGVLYVVAGGGGAPGAPEDFVEGLDSIISYLGMAPGQTVGEYLEEQSWILALIQLLGYGTEYEGGWWRADAEVMKHFILVEVQGGLISGYVYDASGNLFDSWTVGSYDADEVDDDGDRFTELEGDCDDNDPSVNPDAEDDCDGVDNDCDGIDNDCDEEPEPDTGEKPATQDTGEGADEPAKTDGCGCAASPSGVGGIWGLLALLGWAHRRRSRQARINAGQPQPRPPETA